MRRPGKMAKSLGALAFWLGVWALLAWIVDRELLLPRPVTVARRLASLVVTAPFWRVTAVSLGRILLGAVLGAVGGVLTAAGTSRYRFLDAVLSPLLSVIRSTPVASFILLVLIWVGRDILPCVIVFLMVLPVVWGNVSVGVAATDRQLLEMARVYRFGRWQTVRRVYAPSVGPYLLTVPALSVGRQLFEAKLYMDTAGLFGWTAVVVLCSLILEKLFTALIRRLGRRRMLGGTEI